MARANTARDRFWVTGSRIVAGTLGAYGLTAIATVAASHLLVSAGLTRVEAVLAATLASYALFAAIALAVFRARSALKTWTWVGGAGVTLLALCALLGGGAA